MRKKYLAILLMLTLVVQMAQGVSLHAADEDLTLQGATTILHQGEVSQESLVINNVPQPVYGFQFDLDLGTNKTLESLTVGSLTLDLTTGNQTVNDGTQVLMVNTSDGQHYQVIHMAMGNTTLAASLYVGFSTLNTNVGLQVAESVMSVTGFMAIDPTNTPIDVSGLTMAGDLSYRVISPNLEAAIFELQDRINALPASDAITIADKTEIDGLSAEAATIIAYAGSYADIPEYDLNSYAATLEALGLIIDDLAGEITNVEDQILAVTDIDSLTLGDRTTIEANRAAYNALNEDQKGYFSAEALSHLQACEAQIAALEQEKLVVENLVSDIENFAAAHPAGDLAGNIASADLAVLTDRTLANDGFIGLTELQATATDGALSAMILTDMQSLYDEALILKVDFETAVITELQVAQADLQTAIDTAEAYVAASTVIADDLAPVEDSIYQTDIDVLNSQITYAQNILATSENVATLIGTTSELTQVQQTTETKVITALQVAQYNLQATIDEAEAKISSATYGTLEGETPLSAKNNLEYAIDTATVALSSTVVSDLETAQTNLEAAISAFEASVVTQVELLTERIEAIYADAGKTSLAVTATLSEIQAIKATADAEALKSNVYDAGQIADLEQISSWAGAAKGLFYTPDHIMMYTDGSMSLMRAGAAITIVTTVFNSIGVKLDPSVYTELTSDVIAVTYTTGNEAVATIDGTTGVILTSAEGTTTITATLNSDNSIFQTKVVEFYNLPEMIVSNIPVGAFYSTDVTVTAYREADTEEIRIHEGSTTDSAVLASGYVNADYTFTTEASYEILIESGTEGDGQYNAQTLRFTIDKTLPTVSIGNIANLDANNTVDNGTVTIPAMTATDANGIKTSSYYIEKMVDGSYVYLRDVTAAQVITQTGSYRLVAMAKDMAGNQTSTNTSFTITKDMSVPTISLTGVSAINTEAVTPTVALEGGTYVSDYTYTIEVTKPDGTVSTNTDSSVTFDSAGAYALTVTAVNPNNPGSKAIESLDFVIDLATPVINVSGVTDGLLTNKGVTPVVAITDADGLMSASELYANATITLTRNGSAITFVNGAAITKEGAYVLTVSETDLAGKSATPVTIDFTIDTTAPVLTISGTTADGSISSGGIYDKAVVITVASPEASAGNPITVKDASGSTVNLTNNQFTVSGVSDTSKSYKYTATLTDAAGNKATASLAFTIDLSPVSFNISGVAEGEIYTAMPTITATAGDNNDPVSPVITNNGSGSYTATFTYANAAGTEYATAINFIVDTTVPSINDVTMKLNGSAITVAALAKVKQGDILEVTADVSDVQSDVASVLLRIGHLVLDESMDDQGDGTYVLAYTFPGGDYASLDITVKAFNGAGLADDTTVDFIALDNTAPSVTLTMGPTTLPTGMNGYYVADHVTMRLTTDSADGTIYYTYPLGGVNSDTEVAGAISLTEGKNIVTYYASDDVGNESETVIKTVYVDSVDPAAAEPTGVFPLTTADSVYDLNGSVAGEGNLGTTVTVLLNGSNIGQVAVDSQDGFQLPGIVLDEGVNTIETYAKDYAGNIGPVTSVDITVDTTEPTFTVIKDNLTYTITSSESIASDLYVAYNGDVLGVGTAITNTGGNSTGSSFTFDVDSSFRVEGKNVFVIQGADTAGNMGEGTLSTNYIPPATAQEDVEVTGDTTMDIPSDAFPNISLMTVQTVESETSSDYKSLGSAVLYEFTEEPSAPVIIKTYVGENLVGVGLIHIGDNGVSEEFVPAVYTTLDMENLEALTEDTPYYDPATGYLVLRTMSFSTYQNAQDIVKPEITVTTSDFELNAADITAIAGNASKHTVAGTVTDNAGDASIVDVLIDGVSQGLTSGAGSFGFDLSLSNGSHQVGLVAEDAAGNSKTVYVTYTVDQTPPTLELAGVATSTEQQVNLSVTTNELATITINGQAKGSVEGQTTYAVTLASGSNTFIVVATDAMGNTTTASKTIERTVAVDLTGVAVVGDNPTEATTVTIAGTLNTMADIYVNDVLVASDQAAGAFNIANIALEIGQNTIEIKAIDAAGYSDAATIVVTRNEVADPGDGDTGNNDNNSTNTGTYIPILEPVEESAPEISSAMPIPSGAGTLEFGDTGVIIKVPYGAFEGTGDINVTSTDLATYMESHDILSSQSTGMGSMSVVGRIFTFQADQTFTRKLTLSIPVTLEDGFTATHSLAVYRLNETTGEWEFVGGRYNPSTGTVDVGLSHFSTYAVMQYNASFDDISSHWAKDYIQYLADMHVINGKAEGLYKPNETVTRAEFAKLMAYVADLDVSDTSHVFADVDSSAWYAGSINAVYLAGIADGYSDKTFKPNANISRQEMVVMLMNLYDYLSTNDEQSNYDIGDLTFDDNDKIPSWAKQSVAAATALEIISGKGGNLFDPGNNATRAEAAKVIKVLLDAVN